MQSWSRGGQRGKVKKKEPIWSREVSGVAGTQREKGVGLGVKAEQKGQAEDRRGRGQD